MHMHLSPSTYHRHLMSQLRPRYRYDGGDLGNSGRGTVSAYAAAILPRLAYAMPKVSMTLF